ANQVKAAPKGNQGVRVELVDHAGGVSDTQPVFTNQTLDDRAQQMAEIAIILGRVWYRVKFPFQRGEVGALECRQASGELIPQVLDAFFEDRAFEKFEQRQGEVE